MKTTSTFRRLLILGLAFVMMTTTLPFAPAGAQTADAPASCLIGAQSVSAMVLVDNPFGVDAVAPVVRQEVAALILADLVALNGDDRSVEVAVGQTSETFSVAKNWTPLDASTYTSTVEAVAAVAPTTVTNLATGIEGAQQALVDRVDENGCGIVVALPIGPVALTADETGELCASGGTIDGLRSLPAHLGIVATPTAIAGVDRSLLETLAGTAGAQGSCGSVPAEGMVIEGATRAELLAPAGRFIDDLIDATEGSDETAVCRVFACPEGSTTISALAGTESLSFEGVFAAFGYDVVLESPTGDKLSLPGDVNSTNELGGATITTLWASPATVAVSIAGESLEGDWTATVIDVDAGAETTAKWRHATAATVVPSIISISPTDAGSDATVEVAFVNAAGDPIDPALTTATLPEGVLVDPVTGSTTPIVFGEVVDGVHVGTVALPADLGPDAEVIITAAGGQTATSTFAVTDGSATAPPPVVGGQESDDGSGLSTLAWIGLAVVAVILVAWLVKHRRREQPVADVRSGTFDIVIGSDGFISRVVDDKLHPLFFRGPDFSDLDTSSKSVAIDGLSVTNHKEWNPLATTEGHAVSADGPVIGSGGRVEADGTLHGVVNGSLARSWAFTLDVDASARANEGDSESIGVVRGRLDVFIDDSLAASNGWLTQLVEELPDAARDSYRWSREHGLTDIRLGGKPMAGTYAEFASMVTD
ncbi:MAG: hypothetical protein ACR2QE_02565 [Acidimicrobiales bacterium]